MEQENYFTTKFSSKTDKELESIINNPSGYDKRAVQAAVWLLEKRGKNSEITKKAQKFIYTGEQKTKAKLTIDIGIPVPTQSRTNRFLHAIIDSFLIQLVIYIIALLPSVSFNALFGFIILPIYYIYFETKFRQTPGKMVTDSMVTYANGDPPTMKSVVLRTAARFVPFEALSCLNVPSWGWHDKWSKTYVIRKNDLEKLKK